MMNLTQTKLVGLTMELDLKVKEYQMLCVKLEQVKSKNIDPNDERLIWLKDLFLKNYNEIAEINDQLKKIKSEEEKKEDQYSQDNLFNSKKDNKKEEFIVPDESNTDIMVVQQSMFTKIINKIKSFFK